MNKKISLRWVIFSIFILVVAGGKERIHAQGLSELADKTSQSIIDFFNDKYNIRTSITHFENVSGIPDLSAQKFYQLVIAELETAAKISFTDLLVNFSQNKGEFNLNQVISLNYLISIRLSRNKTRIGAGISIFSRTLDKVIHVKYLETLFEEQETDMLNTTRYPFEGLGFSKIIELDAQPNLLDVKSFLDADGQLVILYYFPEEVEIYKLQENQLKKNRTHPFKWARPYYPTLANEGKASVFLDNGMLVLTFGNNFSKVSRVLIFKNGRVDPDPPNLIEADVDFVPFRHIELNGAQYIAGTRYAVGKNYFEGKLILAPYNPEWKFQDDSYLEKDVPSFYALDYATPGDSRVLTSIHIVDRSYKYKFYADNFEQLVVEGKERGASLCCFNGQWLAVSDFSSGSDRLYFYKIQGGSRNLVFENPVDGEIVFISEGAWMTAKGFWVYTCKPGAKNASSYVHADCKLQFWSKKSE